MNCNNSALKKDRGLMIADGTAHSLAGCSNTFPFAAIRTMRAMQFVVQEKHAALLSIIAP